MITSILKFATVVSFGASVLAKPIQTAKRQSSGSFPSFNSFGNLDSLSNFDSFFGRDNFDGSFNQQVIFESNEVVCHQIDVSFLQQRFAIMREFIKRILIEQVCEVETQTIILEQFSSGISSFGRDLRRQSGRSVSFDSSIANRFSQLFDSNGFLSDNDLGFSGNQIGLNDVFASGSNWNDISSPQSVGNIWQASQNAFGSAQNLNAPGPAITTSAPAPATSTASATESSSSSSSESESSTSSASSAAATATNVNSD